MSLFSASAVTGFCAVNKCQLNWSCSVGSQNSSGLTCQTLYIHCTVSNFLTIWHALSIAAFCIRLCRAWWEFSRFEVLCKLFGIILVVHSTNGTIYTTFCCHVLIGYSCTSFVIIILVYVSVQYLFSELLHFSSTNDSALFIT